MENLQFKNKPPRMSSRSPTFSLKLDGPLRLEENFKRISDIIRQEHEKLHNELKKNSNIHSRIGVSPIKKDTVSSEDSSDIDEFSTQPISPVQSKKPLNINQTVHSPEIFPSWKSHTYNKPFTNNSESSDELLLSTYEDSLMYSPPHCASPTYIRTDHNHHSPKLFLGKHIHQDFNRSNLSVSSRNTSKSSKEELINRLSAGKKHKISRKEMIEINKRMCQNLPEVKAKQEREKREMERKINALYAKGLQEKLKKKIKSKNNKKGSE